MANILHEDIVTELRRGLDNFMATYGGQVELAAGNEVEIGLPACWVPELERLIKIWSSLSRDCVAVVADVLLQWRAQVICTPKSPIRTSNWLVGKVLVEMLTPAPDSGFSKIAAVTIMDLCFEQCNRSIESERRHSDSSFFAFKTNNAKPTNDFLFDQRIQKIWRRVLGQLALESLSQIRVRLENELRSIPKSAPASIRTHFLQNFSFIRLHLVRTSDETANFRTRLQQVIGFLRTFQPCMTNQNKSTVRNAAMQTVASILRRDLSDVVDTSKLGAVFSCSDADWMNTLQSLHASAKKMCSKKDFANSAWQLRIATLCISNNEMFFRCWKEDAQNILRHHYQHKDTSSLDCIGHVIKNIMFRHAASGKTLPFKKDIMEVVNTIQAWCFSIPKQKSIKKLNQDIMPVLVDITLSLASYDMGYGIQSHIRRLIIEGDSVFDERKLVGLTGLLNIFECLKQYEADGCSKPSEFITPFGMDSATLMSNKSCLSDIVGHILIECNTNFGNESILTSSKAHTNASRTSDYKRRLGLETFRVALQCLPYLYTSIDLNDDQKMMILSRCVIHSDEMIRRTTLQVLESLVIQNNEIASICKGLSTYIMSIHDDESSALEQLLHTMKRLLHISTSDDSCPRILNYSSDIQISLIRVEAMCLDLLCGANSLVRKMAFNLLESARQMHKALIIDTSNPATFSDWTEAQDMDVRSNISVLDVIEDTEEEIRQKFGPTLLELEQADAEGGLVPWLAAQDDAKSSFRWSKCLATIFARVADMCPLVMSSIWVSINAKAYKLEPIITNHGETSPACAKQIERWRNCAIFACAAACSQHAEGLVSLKLNKEDKQETITESSIDHLLKRLCRFLQSGSADQRYAAVLALGSVHPSSHEIFLLAISRYEATAFTDDSDSSDMNKLLSSPKSPTGSYRRSSKNLKQKYIKLAAQLDLQWGVCRCYRSLLEGLEAQNWENETVRTRILSFADHVHYRLRLLNQHSISRASPITAMMQQDFCAIVQSVVHHSNMMCLDDSEGLDVIKRQQWFSTLMDWCCESEVISDESTLELDLQCYWNGGNHLFGCVEETTDSPPWYWIRDGATSSIISPEILENMEQNKSVCTFLLSRIAYPAMANLLVGPAFDTNVFEKESAVFRWIESLLSANGDRLPHVAVLQHFARKGLRSLMQSNIDAIPICMEKCFFEREESKGHLVAKQYIEVISSLIEEIVQDLFNPELTAKMFHICILHLGDQDDKIRSHALRILQVMQRRFEGNATVCPGTATRVPYSNVLIEHITARAQELVSTSLATSVPDVSYDLLEGIFRRLSRNSSTIQHKMLSVSKSWVAKVNLSSLIASDRISLMDLLFQCSDKLVESHGAILCQVWRIFSSTEEYSNFRLIVDYIFDQKHPGRLPTCKLILWWIAHDEPTLNLVLERLMERMRCLESTTESDRSIVVEAAARGILLVSDLSCQYKVMPTLFEPHYVQLLHLVFTMLWVNLFPTSVGSPRKDFPQMALSIDLRNHCHVLLSNLVDEKGAKTSHLVHELRQTTLNSDADANDYDELRSGEVSKCIELLIEAICGWLSPNDRQIWAQECTEWFASSISPPQQRLFSRYSFQIYRIVQPSFDGMVCLRILSLLHTSLDDSSSDVRFVEQMLKTLLSMVNIMSPFKLVMYPQLLWVCIALLHHSNSVELDLPTLQLLQAIFNKPTFAQEIVQDVFLARRPTQWNTSYTSVLRVVMRGLYDPKTEPISRDLLIQMLMTPCSGILEAGPARLLLNTTALLPWLCRSLHDKALGIESGNNQTDPTLVALELGHMWDMEDETKIAAVLLDYSSGKYTSLAEFLEVFSPLFMSFSARTDQYALFESLLSTMRGNCRWLLKPTLLLTRSLVVQLEPGSPILQSNSVLFSTLTRILRSEGETSCWDLIVSVLSAAVSLSAKSSGSNSYDSSNQTKPKPPVMSPERLFVGFHKNRIVSTPMTSSNNNEIKN